MNIQLTITDDRGEPWIERYTIDDSVDPKKWAMKLLTRFNSSLRRGELERRLVKVDRLDGVGHRTHHSWSKVSLVTEMGASGSFDRMKCDVCGITGRRFGFDQVLHRDRKFTAKCYEYCDTSLKLLERRSSR